MAAYDPEVPLVVPFEGGEVRMPPVYHTAPDPAREHVRRIPLLENRPERYAKFARALRDLLFRGPVQQYFALAEGADPGVEGNWTLRGAEGVTLAAVVGFCSVGTRSEVATRVKRADVVGDQSWVARAEPRLRCLQGINVCCRALCTRQGMDPASLAGLGALVYDLALAKGSLFELKAAPRIGRSCEDMSDAECEPPAAEVRTMTAQVCGTPVQRAVQRAWPHLAEFGGKRARMDAFQKLRAEEVRAVRAQMRGAAAAAGAAAQ